MDSAANVTLYQSDYEIIKKIAEENHVSLAQVVSDLIKTVQQRQAGPQVVFQQMNGVNL